MLITLTSHPAGDRVHINLHSVAWWQESHYSDRHGVIKIHLNGTTLLVKESWKQIQQVIKNLEETLPHPEAPGGETLAQLEARKELEKG